jgi:hypothetical protein
MRLGTPYLRADEWGHPIIGLGDDAGFSVDSGIGINTSGVIVNTPTTAQTDYALNALAQQACGDQGGIWNPSNNSCAGGGGSSDCPAGYILSGFSCVKAPVTGSSGAAASGVTAPICPSGQTCSIIPGIPNTSIYVALAAVAALFLFAMGGGRR